jgi:hypothetical protein
VSPWQLCSCYKRWATSPLHHLKHVAAVFQQSQSGQSQLLPVFFSKNLPISLVQM